MPVQGPHFIFFYPMLIRTPVSHRLNPNAYMKVSTHNTKHLKSFLKERKKRGAYTEMIPKPQSTALGTPAKMVDHLVQ